MREKIACRGNYSTCAKVIIDLSRIFKHGNSQVEPLKVSIVSFAWTNCWHGGSVAQGKASFSCSILCPVYLKRRISANVCFWFRFSKIFLARKRWVHKTASSTGDINSIVPLALKNINLGILWTFGRSFSKRKIGKTPTSHIIHLLGGEYWIAREKHQDHWVCIHILKGLVHDNAYVWVLTVAIGKQNL